MTATASVQAPTASTTPSPSSSANHGATRTALVTGASSGIGEDTARKLQALGYIVYGAARRTDRLQALTADGIRPLAMDVTDDASMSAGVNRILEETGRIDVLVNNAGITQDARLVKMTEEQFDRVIDINLRGVFHCSQAVAPGMIERNSGVILNASSVVGLYGNFGQTNYAAAKFGLIGFTKTWSRERGPKGVRVNAVAPGFIATPILNAMPEKVLDGMKARIPMGRLGKPAEIANVYAFLASDEASYINGEVIEVSGGISL